MHHHICVLLFATIPVFKSDHTNTSRSLLFFSLFLQFLTRDCFLQMWDLDDPANFHEIVSRRDAPIKCARILAEPLVPDLEGCPLFGKRPALALASASESPTSKWPNSMVKLFSVPRNEFINQLRFKSRFASCLQVACNPRACFRCRRALQNHLYAFDATRMDKVLVALHVSESDQVARRHGARLALARLRVRRAAAAQCRA
jgi:hypothetical protein